MRLAWGVGSVMLLGTGALTYAQKPIGSVALADADVANAGGGITRAADGRVILNGRNTVTAKDHTAVVKLERSGEIRVCRSTGVHLSQAADDSLLLGIDRGAMEIHTRAQAGDVVTTPDLRFTANETGTFELSLRVTMNGDTCVDNHGRKSPTLNITDAFGEASYQVRPGQHVLFEHGNLREVVDRETTPCGCPPDPDKSMSLADAALAGGTNGKPVTPAQAAAAHPFPVAESEGLAEVSPPATEAPGQTHVQVSTTLAFDPDAPKPVEAPPPAPAPSGSTAAPAKKAGFFASVGHFFKRIFAR